MHYAVILSQEIDATITATRPACRLRGSISGSTWPQFDRRNTTSVLDDEAFVGRHSAVSHMDAAVALPC